MGIFVVLIFFLGLIFGSFFNVCIYRIPTEKSINYPPSHCGNCNTNLKWYDLFPVFSYLFLKGKCRYCGEKVSIQYPLVELLTGVVFATLFLSFGVTLEFFKYTFLFSILIISAIIDYKTQYVFFSVSLVGIIGGVVFAVLEVFTGKALTDVIFSVMIPLIILGIIIIASQKVEGMGAGDLEIFILVALYLTPMKSAIALFLSICLGGVVSVFILLQGRRGEHIAFVPYIAIGTFISIVFSSKMVNWYLSLF